MRIDKEITLDLSNKHPIENIRFHQGDENSICLKITLTQNNEIVDTSALSVLYSATINNYLVESDAKGSTTGSAIYIPITKNMSALSGELNIEIKLIETDENGTVQILYTRNLRAQVERSIVDGDLVIDFSGLTLVDLINSKLDDANGVVTTSHLQDSSVTSAKLATYAVTSTKIGSGAVSTTKLGSKAVTTEKMADSAVTTNKIADKAVTTEKLAEGAVSTVKLDSEAVTTEKIADKSITTEKIADKNVTTSKLADKSVTTNKLADVAVGTDQIAFWAVNADKIKNECIDLMKLTPELSEMIIGKVDYVNLGNIVTWDDFGDVVFKEGVLYHISTFVGNMATDIDYGNCWGFSNGSETSLIVVNTSTGYWWIVDIENQTKTKICDFPKAKNVTITDSNNNYYSDNLEGALLEIAQRLGKKADYESGEILSDNVAWYTNNSDCLITGTYQLVGDYCILTANASLVDGWGNVFYSLPVASISGYAATIAVNKKQYIVSTAILDNISTIEIRRLDGSLMSTLDDTAINFTITYKYR